MSFKKSYLIIAQLLIVLLLPVAAFSQFGKNKVQYKDFDFKIIESEHFDVYFYESERVAALDATRMAERAYARLSRVLNHKIRKKIPLILYASQTDFQQTNTTSGALPEGVGGFTESLKDRVVLPFTGSYAEFQHVLEHELVHAFQYDILLGGSGAAAVNPLAFSPPTWFFEGMAEYLAAGEVDIHTKMWLRDASLQGYLISIPQLSQSADIRVYRFGQSIFEFIGRRYGDEKIGELLQKAPRFGDLDKSFKSSIGINLEELSEAWTEEVRKTYLPQIAEYQKPKKFSRQLTDHLLDLSNINLAPTISPDGELMAFISDRTLYNDIYLASANDGRVITKLVEGERTESFETLRYLRNAFSWSPDGRYIAFAAKAGAEDALYVMRVKNKKIVRKLKFGLDGITAPSWSPDGKRIVFSGLDGGLSNLYVVDIDGKNFKQLTNDRYTARDPQWSPNGKTIAFTTDRGSKTNFEELVYGDYKIALYQLDTGKIDILSDQRGKNINPQWSPDGKELAFISDRTGISNIYIINLESNEVFKITDVLTGITGIVPSSPSISWSRKSDRLIFSAFSSAGWDIYAIQDPSRLKKPYLPPLEETIAQDAKKDEEVIAENAVEETKSVEEAHTEIDTVTVTKESEKKQSGARSIYLRDVFASDEDAAETAAGASQSELVVKDDEIKLGLPDPKSFKVRDYKLKFSIDYITRPQIGFASNVGAFGGSALSFSDMLGNHNVFLLFDIFGSIQDSNIFAQYTYLKPQTNIGFGFFQFRRDLLPLFASSTTTFDVQVWRGGYVLFSRPLSRFRRIEYGLQLTSVSQSVRQFSFITGRETTQEELGGVFFVTPKAAFVFDNALFGSTGPIAGTRYRLEMEYSRGDNQFETTQLIADYRKYFNMQQRYTFAVRFIYGTSRGRDQQRFFIGGSNTIRGFDFGELFGTNIGIFNAELRFPLFDRLTLAPLRLAFPPIRGAFFFDTGFANSFGSGEGTLGALRFSDSFGEGFEDLKASFGVGLRFNLFGFGVLKFDYAFRTDFSSIVGPKDGKGYITLYPEF